ncbi:MAG: hypothetical protein A3F78_16340 [Burkholderiales bacterium RIFCSPLOWO2_12_FULL_61_40]|nr:MAG: hypothetical protein A3F78_16340 [Burkholderiales bacterium RIFCSPLOWO2_12_FULL_61_40]
MGLNDVAGDAKAQTGTGAVALLAVAQAHMGLKGQGHGSLREAEAKVAHFHHSRDKSRIDGGNLLKS